MRKYIPFFVIATFNIAVFKMKCGINIFLVEMNSQYTISDELVGIGLKCFGGFFTGFLLMIFRQFNSGQHYGSGIGVFFDKCLNPIGMTDIVTHSFNYGIIAKGLELGYGSQTYQSHRDDRYCNP